MTAADRRNGVVEMDVHHPPRYCRVCGGRLAWDNHSTRCTPCQKRQRDLRVRPPDVPPHFWDADLIRDALDQWHIGKVIRAYRHHPYHNERPLTQELVAGWLSLTQAQLSRIESGPAVTDLAKLISWARILHLPPHLLWFKLPEHRTKILATAPKYEPPLSAPSVLIAAAVSGDGAADAAAMQSFRAADLQLGGGHLYPSVVNYLQTTLAPRLFDDTMADPDNVLFTAAAALTEMAGWMAHDAGRDGAAARHFDRALDLARVSGDQQLNAHVLASKSHLARHLKQPTEAIRFAREGQDVLRGAPLNAELQARLLTMEARGHAALNDSSACVSALLQAERSLGKAASDASSPWLSGFDQGSLAGEAAHCLRQLGQLDQAQRQAERVLSLRSSRHTRSRAFGQLILVAVLIARGKPDEACDIATEVLDGTQSLGSFLVIQQLQNLRRMLRPYQSSTVVSAFQSHLDDALSKRLWLYGWLAQGNDGAVIRSPTEGP